LRQEATLKSSACDRLKAALHSIGSKTEANNTNAWLRRRTSPHLRSEVRLIEKRDWEEGHLFEILELKNADAAVPAEVGTATSRANKPWRRPQSRDDLQGNQTQSGRKPLVGTGFGGLAKVLDFQCRLKKAQSAHAQLSQPKPCL